MISFKKTFYKIKCKENWFEYKSSRMNLFSFNVYRHLISDPGKIPIWIWKENEATLLIRLTNSTEEIVSKIKTEYRKDIQKGNNLGIDCLVSDDLELFYFFYQKFALKKGIYIIPYSIISELKAHLVITQAILQNELLVAHAYLTDHKTGIARLFISASNRLESNIDSKTIGIANKLLTQFDINYFKQNNYTYFDFGGIAPDTVDKELQGINRFKKGFGGEKVKTYNLYPLPYYLIHLIAQKIDRRYK